MQDKITYPDISTLLPHQIELLKDFHRFPVICWHRRSRKTTTALHKLVIEACNPDLPKKVFWYVCPTAAEAKEIVWKDPGMLFNERVLPRSFIEKTNEVELTIYLRSGSIICLKSADAPERLLGAGPHGIILDEFAMMKSEVWERIIQPIVRANPKGFVWFVSTPKGKNHFYKLFRRGLKPDSEWRSWKLKASDSGILSKEQLELARQDMPEPLFRQEFEVEWLEGEGSVFRGVKEIATAEPQKPLEGHRYIMGVDLAKAVDYTVVVVYDRATNSQAYQDRWKTIEWPFQKKKIKSLADYYNHALVYLDATGVGDPIADDLLREGIALEPYKITEPSKKELIEKLSIFIEQGRIKILPIKESIDEFENFSYELGPTGRVKYGAPGGFHDDIVIAHALAVHGLFPLGESKPKEEPISLVKMAYLKQKRLWEEEDFSNPFDDLEWQKAY